MVSVSVVGGPRLSHSHTPLVRPYYTYSLLVSHGPQRCLGSYSAFRNISASESVGLSQLPVYTQSSSSFTSFKANYLALFLTVFAGIIWRNLRAGNLSILWRPSVAGDEAFGKWWLDSSE